MKREIYILFCVLIMSLASYIHMNGQVVDIITLADTSVINSSYYVPIIDSDSVNDRIHSDSVHNALKKHKVADPIKEKLNYYLNGGWPNPSARTVATRLFTERLKLPLVVFPMDKKLEKPQLPTHLNFATNHSSEDFFHNQPIGLDQMEIQDRILNDMFKNNMWDFAYTKSYLDNYKYEIKQVEPEKVKLFSEEEYANTDKADNPLSNMEDAFNKRRYWSTVYESTLQFSQNYVSSNWYKGGSSNLNLFSRNYFTFEYNREKVKWFNELEYKLSVYNSQGDTVRKYRVADDLLRFHTNYGYKAYSNWYYSADAEVRTQLFNANKENSHDLQAALFSPITLDFGLGMKYELAKKSEKVYGRKLKLSLNIAPFAYNMKWSARKNIDLARHGFKDDKNYLYQFISSFKAEMRWDFNMNLSYISRLYYTTSYHDARVEWENTINCALTKYLSTRFYFYLRYDDTTNPSTNWGRYLQINELVSIGLNYRIGK